MPEALVLFTPDDLPPALADTLPQPLRQAALVFWLARSPSPAVQAVMQAVPEPPMAEELVESGMALARLLSQAIPDSPLFCAHTRAPGQPAQPASISAGFHTGPPAQVRAAFEMHADVQPLAPYLAELRLARVQVSGLPPPAVYTLPTPRRARPLGGGWVALDPSARRLWTAAGRAPVRGVPAQALSQSAPPMPPDPITEDDVADRIFHHFAHTPITWRGSPCWGALLPTAGGLTLLWGGAQGAVTATSRPQPRWLPDGPVALRRFDAWARAYRAAWMADDPQTTRPLTVLDPTLLALPELQTDDDFAHYAFDLDALAARLAPEVVPRRVPEAAGLSEPQLRHAWFWLPEVAHRYQSAPSAARLKRLPELVVVALARAWIAGPADPLVTPDLRVEAGGLAALRGALGKPRLDALSSEHQRG